MAFNIIEILQTKSKSELIHLIGSSPKFITNPDLINLIHQYDINNRTKDELISKQMTWFLKYRIWVKLVKDSSIGITEFHFLNKLGDEIEIG